MTGLADRSRVPAGVRSGGQFSTAPRGEARVTLDVLPGDNGLVIDETGNSYGELTVVSRRPAPPGRHGAHWLCQCSCGNATTVPGVILRQGRTQSCGHARNGAVIDETGNTYGELTVRSRADSNSASGEARWLCRCSCGNETTVPGRDLRRGNTRSCGHLWEKARDAGSLGRRPDEAAWQEKADALGRFRRERSRWPRRRSPERDEAMLARWIEDVRASAATGRRPSLSTPERLAVLDNSAPGWRAP